MTEFTKIAAAIKMWGWGRTWMILATLLLLKHIVTFEQALSFFLLNVAFEGFAYGQRPPVRAVRRGSPVSVRRRLKAKSARTKCGSAGGKRG